MARSEISKVVEEVYRWIDAHGIAHTCTGCGDCCNFTEYDHLLFVTGVELIHFAEAMGEGDIKPMENGICPYREDGKCTVYENRFAGCRIFSCRGDADFQSLLTEKALTKLRSIHQTFAIGYKYVDLAAGLNNTTE